MDPLLAATVEDFLCDESFQRYCRGEDKADVIYWEEWINSNPDKQTLVTHAKRLFDVLNLGQGNRLEQLTVLKDALERRYRFKAEVLNNPEVTIAAPNSAKVIKFRRRSLLKYAAGIILLITAGTLSYLQYNNGVAAKLHTYEYYTGMHERKTIMLPDSSIIMLNSNSHLLVSPNFNKHHRQVAVTGEAFFNVHHDTDHPFLVNTEQYTIRVLGTTFNVRAYPGNDTTETTLLTGKVEIMPATNDNAPTVVLKPNQKFILAAAAIRTKAHKPISLSKGEVVNPVMETVSHHLMETGWARSKMEIKDKTLLEITEKLQAWYGIKIRFADEAVKGYRYTAVFDDETVFNILQYLQQSYPFTYSIEDDCIVIAKS